MICEQIELLLYWRIIKLRWEGCVLFPTGRRMKLTRVILIRSASNSESAYYIDSADDDDHLCERNRRELSTPPSSPHSRHSSEEKRAKRSLLIRTPQVV
eukprot:328734-Hanusia_phi.AAC.2